MAVDWSSGGSVTIYYVGLLPVLWMTSYFRIYPLVPVTDMHTFLRQIVTYLPGVAGRLVSVVLLLHAAVYLIDGIRYSLVLTVCPYESCVL